MNYFSIDGSKLAPKSSLFVYMHHICKQIVLSFFFTADVILKIATLATHLEEHVTVSNPHWYSLSLSLTHTHTHTHMLVFYGLRGLSIGVMVFILYKLYVLLPYT